MSGIMDSVFGSGNSTQDTQYGTVGQSPDEIELTKLNTQIAQRQLQNMDALAPFQSQMLDLTMADLKRQGALNSAYDAAITPQQQAAAAKSDFERSQRLGPIQDQILQMQLDSMKQGGMATDAQKKQIADATNAAIDAGSNDIDIQAQRGVSQISDELANQRGMRLSDSPIGQEAGLLLRGAQDQKGSLTKNLRAAQAQSVLNYPLAVQGQQSAIGMSQQQLSQSVQQFQSGLQQQAFQNRLALSGQAASGGLGLANVGSGVGSSTLGTLTGNRNANGWKGVTGFDPAANNQGYGSFMSGLGKLANG